MFFLKICDLIYSYEMYSTFYWSIKQKLFYPLLFPMYIYYFLNYFNLKSESLLKKSIKK
jgi:hypothetical protein